jgi:hypothetical protein
MTSKIIVGPIILKKDCKSDASVSKILYFAAITTINKPRYKKETTLALLCPRTKNIMGGKITSQ